MRTHRLTRILILLILTLYASVAPALAGDCHRAPRSRLRVGDSAVISPTIRRLNLRALPAVGTGLVAVLNPGTQVTVLSGPSCNGNYNWWRVETASGRRGWVAEGDWIDYYVVPAADANREINPAVWTCLASSRRWCPIG